MAAAEQLQYSEALNISEAFSLLFLFSPTSNIEDFPGPTTLLECILSKNPLNLKLLFHGEKSSEQ